jgi:hypothetical protein
MKTKTVLVIVMMLALIIVTSISQSLVQVQPIYVTLPAGAHAPRLLYDGQV